ncbi:MAG: methionyl-tRNA formyltransferase [Chloroflexi bacterium HGW-Chloroflexi-10]|nr:MAG: methionyl-tRNA formyltransferase [Chloroflexi bacterium HGW-Chloroflexi-10]
MKPKFVFMGSPDISIPTLEALITNYSVVGVVTQPDRPAGRGKTLNAPPVKLTAQMHDIPVIQPVRLKDAGVYEQLEEWLPDVIVVIAFGQILRQNVLDLPPFGCVNIHASILPRWRGAAPIQASILHGDEKTGVTIMRMDAGIDTGPILRKKEIPITPQDTTETLGKKLANLGAELLLSTLPEYLNGFIRPIPQPEEGATYAKLIQKSDGHLDFSKSALILERQIRAYNPWPGTSMALNGAILKVNKGEYIQGYQLTPGKRIVYQKFPAVGTMDGLIVLREVQPPGKKNMPGDVFLRGYHYWENE